MKITKTKLREIIRQTISEESEYQKFFRSELEKSGFSSPDEMSDEEKREFFSTIDKNWDAKNEDVISEYDEWRNTRIQAKNIFRMLKQKYNNDISKMKDGLETIFKQNKTKPDQAEVVKQEFNKYFKIKEGNAFGAAVTKAKEQGKDSFKVGGKTYSVKESSRQPMKWQDAEVGDMANVTATNKTGIIVKPYGRKFHLKFVDGTMKTYDAKELTFIKNESVVNESEIKVGSTIIVNHPTLKKPFEGKVKFILKAPTGLVYVLPGDKGVWDEKWVSLKESKINESKYDLMFGKLGNGITVSNKKETDPNTKDYKFIAHISNTGKVEWKDKNAQKDSSVRREVEKHVKSMNESDCGCGDTNVVESTLPNAVIPSAINVKLNMAIDKIKDAKLTYNQKLKLIGTIIDSLGIDKKELTKMAPRLRGTLESVNEGNAFGAAVTAAKKAGQKEFEFNGKTYKVKKGSYEKNEEAKKESVNESTTRTAMEIGALTGMNKDFIQKFVDANKLDIEKVFQYVKRGKLKDRMDFVTALSGKPNNPIQKKLITMLKESVNESKIIVTSVDKIPNIQNLVNQGKVTYRGLGVGKIANDFANIAGEMGTRIKVGGKEYFITDSDFQKLGGIKKIRFAAPFRRESVNETKFYAFFNGKKHEIEGDSLYDAKQKAITQLKVPKSKVGLLAIVNAGEHEKGSFKFEGLSPDIAKYMIGIYKGFEKVENDGVMIYDSPKNAEKAAEYLNKKKIAASSNGKYLYIESKESITEGKHDSDLDKVEAAVKNASSFMGVGAELKKAGIKYDFSTSMIPMYRIKVAGNTIGIANKKYVAGAEREVKDIAIGLLEGNTGRSLKVENLSPDIAKHMIGIYKGFQKVESDGVMIYDSPKNAEKAAEYLNKKKIAASSDGKYLYIESKG